MSSGIPLCYGDEACKQAALDTGCGDSSPFSVTFKRGESPDSEICSGHCSANMGDIELCTGDTCNAQFSYTGKACIPSSSDNENPDDGSDDGSSGGDSGGGDTDDGSSGGDTGGGDTGGGTSGGGDSGGGTSGGGNSDGGTSGGGTSGGDTGSDGGIDGAGIIGAINNQTSVLDSSIQNVADKTQAIDTAIYNEIVPKLEHLASVDDGINAVNDKIQTLVDGATTAQEVRNAQRMLLDNISEWNEQTYGTTQEVLEELRAVSCGLDPNCLDNGDAGGGDNDGGDGNGDGSDGGSDGGGDGSGDGNGDPSGECDPETEDCGDGTGDANSANLTCTEQAQDFQCSGDPIQCQQLRLQFEQACIGDDLEQLEGKVNEMTDFEMNDVLVQDESVSLSNIVNNPEQSVSINEGCPAPKQVQVMGSSIEFSYDMICQLASTLRPLFILLCSVLSMFMVGRALAT
ncbi:virulence factor TspB C-terminal domain-related protein [Salinivibrio kushneri]|uniref:virulence factor TspB C-terminal domain-related protein n=1 Tax=Salinivibrio kushneri TaxID=1908198 RepID=UPI0018FE908C|nr:virulence factor TspB C-terminal domain-related protein [Salinivibrio kushneri]